MSKFGNPWATTVRVTIGPVARPVGAIRFVPFRIFEGLFACKINALPENICALGWLASERCWYCAPTEMGIGRQTKASNTFHHRGIEKLLSFIATHVVERPGAPDLWFLFCFDDGWRERTSYSRDYRWITPPDLTGWPEWRGTPGELPVLSPDRHWLACFGAHRGDPSTLLLPDAHYLQREFYVPLFAEIDRERIPWSKKKSRLVFAGGDHGESSNLFKPTADAGLHPRRLFKRTVEAQALDADVYLGRPLARGEQLTWRYIADIDGYARTWDAWAWKMVSGSAVLSVESPWVSFFSEQFSAWEHYIPVANDCSDLAEKIEWCQAHDSECEAIAERARARATHVYDRENTGRRLLELFQRKLAEPLPF